MSNLEKHAQSDESERYKISTWTDICLKRTPDRLAQRPSTKDFRLWSIVAQSRQCVRQFSAKARCSYDDEDTLASYRSVLVMYLNPAHPETMFRPCTSKERSRIWERARFGTLGGCSSCGFEKTGAGTSWDTKGSALSNWKRQADRDCLKGSSVILTDPSGSSRSPMTVTRRATAALRSRGVLLVGAVRILWPSFCTHPQPLGSHARTHF